MNEDAHLEMAYEDRFAVERDDWDTINDVDDDSDPEALNEFDQRLIDDDFDNDFNIHS